MTPKQRFEKEKSKLVSAAILEILFAALLPWVELLWRSGHKAAGRQTKRGSVA
jgi:hypothetical protein